MFNALLSIKGFPQSLLIIALFAIYVDGCTWIPKPKLNSTAAKWGETRRDTRLLFVYSPLEMLLYLFIERSFFLSNNASTFVQL